MTMSSSDSEAVDNPMEMESTLKKIRHSFYSRKSVYVPRCVKQRGSSPSSVDDSDADPGYKEPDDTSFSSAAATPAPKMKLRKVPAKRKIKRKKASSLPVAGPIGVASLPLLGPSGIRQGGSRSVGEGDGILINQDKMQDLNLLLPYLDTQGKAWVSALQGQQTTLSRAGVSDRAEEEHNPENEDDTAMDHDGCPRRVTARQ